MKPILGIAVAIILSFSFSLRAQMETASPAPAGAAPETVAALLAAAGAGSVSPLPPDAIPQRGTFFSLDYPPMPTDWAAGCPVYALGQGRFLIDDSSWEGTGRQGDAEMASSMDDSGLPPLPDGSGNGTNLSGGQIFSYVVPTNGLWMQINRITNGIVSLTLNNATDMVYEIWSAESLTNSLTNWTIEQEVWPVTDQTSTPFTVEMQDRTNNLFFGARDWTGITSDGNLTTPEWWLWEYFGEVELSETNMDSSGNNTLLFDYQNSIDPNVIYFSVNVINPDFNTSNATVQITVSGGVPSYMAALVDSTNFALANWTSFNSNLTFNLGSVEGWHTVSVGLKGLPQDAQQTWNQIQLKLVLSPPVLVVTNPIVGVVTQPFIQLQGYCLENLASMSYDLSNATCFETNQQAFVTTRQFDTNNFEYTTNGFQCFNIPMANGTNTVTLHATDSAGNVTATNLVFVLDPTANTNPPAISLSWPQNNASISGTKFPALGVVNDPFASVNAQIVNGGSTSSLTSLVEQNGSFWIENLPLGSGTNYLTITAINTAGYGSVTNIVVVQSLLTLTIGSVTFNDPISPTATVTCTLAGSSDNVSVNGVSANNNGDGTWTAYYVPVGDSGTATVTAEATASGFGSAGYTADASANGSSGGADAQTTEDIVRGPQTALVEYRWNNPLQQVSSASSLFSEQLTQSFNWDYGSSGNSSWCECTSDYPPPYTSYCYSYWTVERSCSLFQFKDFSVAAAGGADFGCEEFLEGNAFG
ncbi:MAG: hypothetical protein ABSA83_23195 [Verrucomicrobiota bacterium]|jgi:uncharacterized Zn-binding protein involved in type VI secretion